MDFITILPHWHSYTQAASCTWGDAKFSKFIIK